MNDLKQLPSPETDMDFPLMKALKERRTRRKWSQETFSDQEMSNLLWAACGITAEETKRSKSKRTAPSACNTQEITVYAALAEGVFLYEEKSHRLIRQCSEDLRGEIGTQKMMKTAPLGLVYVSDFSRFKRFIFGKDEERKWYTSTADTGFISQNVYLYAAAAGWNTALLGLVDRDRLHTLMGLGENQRIVYTQVIGKQISE